MDPQIAQLQNTVAQLVAAVKVLAARLPSYVTVEEAARILDVSPRTVRRRIANREWPAVGVGKEVRVDLSAVLPGLKAAA